MSLRARLLLVLGVLSAAGLLAADIATYTVLRSSLFDRVDSSLDTTANGVARAVDRSPAGPGRPIGARAPRAAGRADAGMYVEVRETDGTRRSTACSRDRARRSRARASRRASARRTDSVRRATIGATTGGTRFRLLARRCLSDATC